MADRPNILFVFPDQLSARWLPCYGNRTVEAPTLSRFASQSTQFNRAYTNIPLCTPYRACLLTGKYPSQTGVTHNGMPLPDGQMTLAHMLQDGGYETHYIGKWHLSGEPKCNRWVPLDQRGGFQNFIGWESHHVDHNSGLIWHEEPGTPESLGDHETDGLTSIVCKELKKLEASNSPFFMAVSYQAPHAPCTPPEAYKSRYDQTVLDEPPNTARDSWFKNMGWNADYGVEEFRKRYFGEISHLDAAFGKVLKTLEQSGLADHTIVIFTSDHGDMAGCHGLFGKGVMFDESVRVPLLVRIPGETAKTIAAPVSTVDLFSTILDMAGVESEEEGEGQSLLPQIMGEPHTATDVFIEHLDDCIIRGDLKLVTNRDDNDITHCFNLADDPYELNNLTESLDRDLLDSLLGSLNEWRNRTRGSNCTK